MRLRTLAFLGLALASSLYAQENATAPRPPQPPRPAELQEEGEVQTKMVRPVPLANRQVPQSAPAEVAEGENASRGRGTEEGTGFQSGGGPTSEAEVTPAPTDVEEPAVPQSSDPRVRTVPRLPNGVPPVTGPLFKINGAAAVTYARAMGYKFSPAGGLGARDGIHTRASQFPNVTTSEVDGVRMMQMRPAAGWAISKISNQFYMFVDASLKPVPLNSGWKIRGLHLNGPNWAWAGQPASGAPTASFALTLVAFRNSLPATVVELDTITLEGPKGSTDWRQAFAPVAAEKKR